MAASPPSPSSGDDSDLIATRYPLLATSDLQPFLAELLSDQQKLQTPVTRAATAHALQPSAWRAERFRELIPLTAPAPGQQYAFEVDLDSCSGCKACVSGCHSLNGLDDEETWRDVGLVYGLSALAAPVGSSLATTAAPASDVGSSLATTAPAAANPAPLHPFAQTVTTACHHCADPACLNGCPVLAYEKDPVTGIVRHLDDQCIGCSYCVLKCPYDVPKYNERLGIVRKCDMCHGRLAAGEAPACAQACPTQAIKIVLVGSPLADPASRDSDAPERSEVPQQRDTPYDSVIRLPADPTYTQPTTRYVSKKPLPPGLRAADADTLRPQPAHWALVFFLTGTQLSLGLLLATLADSQITNHKSPITAAAAAAVFFAALAASVAHLGQPLRAWRVFLGLRRSWLSREAVLLGAAAPFVAATALLPYLPFVGSSLAKTAPALSAALAQLTSALSQYAPLLTASAIALTAAGVFSSAMIYIDTRRHFWRAAPTFARMGGTVLVAALAILTPPFAALALVTKLAAEFAFVAASPTSARLYADPLHRLARTRLALGIAATAALTLLPAAPALLLPLGLVLFALGELAERALYFRAVDAPKMPGQPAATPASSH
jgi:Fe-S-cluster-containing dehydrogenase component/DMSO reductase anchor subunit